MFVRVKTLSGSFEIVADTEPYSEEWDNEIRKNLEPCGVHVHISKGQAMQLSRLFRAAAQCNVESCLAPVFLSIVPTKPQRGKGEADADEDEAETTPAQE